MHHEISCVSGKKNTENTRPINISHKMNQCQLSWAKLSCRNSRHLSNCMVGACWCLSSVMFTSVLKGKIYSHTNRFQGSTTICVAEKCELHNIILDPTRFSSLF